MGIDVEKYFIPENKKIDHYIKFGFYCDTCDAYMTGQNQLIMVRIKKKYIKEISLELKLFNLKHVQGNGHNGRKSQPKKKPSKIKSKNVKEKNISDDQTAPREFNSCQK